MSMKKDRVITIMLIVLLLATIGLLLNNYINNIPPTIKSITYSDSYNEDRSRDVTLKLKSRNTKPIYCVFKRGDEVSERIKTKNGKCSYNVVSDTYIVDLEYNNGKHTSYNEEFNIDGSTSEFTLENVDTSESIPYMHLNRNLQRVIETYATSQFLFNLGMRPCCFDFQNTNRVSMTTTEDLLYIRKYLLQNNYDKLVGGKEIVGSDIDYPVR